MSQLILAYITYENYEGVDTVWFSGKIRNFKVDWEVKLRSVKNFTPAKFKISKR